MELENLKLGRERKRDRKVEGKTLVLNTTNLESLVVFPVLHSKETEDNDVSLSLKP